MGEALVGNEAVDQLVKFNQSLSDNSEVGAKPRLIDGIVLTKFDTIDDKVFFNTINVVYRKYMCSNLLLVMSFLNKKKVIS